MTYYITTPAFYVNDLPHIGHAYTMIATEFFAAHMMQRGEDVAFMTGLDEHGQKIEKAAAANNKSPQQHCDDIAESFTRLWDLLEIKYDYMTRTSSPAHKDFVVDFYNRVKSNGDIYKGTYTGLYCVSCEDFKLEKDLEEMDGQLCCPVHKQPAEEYEQENYFFALSKYSEKLEKYIQDNPDFISPDYRKNEVLSWIKEGLKDFPISRVGLNWGIDIPDDSGDANGNKQKIYVWFDALTFYLSGLGEDRDKYWSKDTYKVQVIGKDILRFHAVYWPAMLMSAGYPLPDKVFGHGFLTKDGMKMGKTLGNVIDPVALTKDFGADAVKFYFMRELTFGKDGDFTQDSFITRLNADLANNLGNLLNRCLNIIKKNFDGVIPDVETSAEFKEIYENLEVNFFKLMDKMSPHFALEELFLTLNKVNAYVNDTAPWKLLKTGEAEDIKKAQICLVTALELCYKAAIYLAPLTPQLSLKIMFNLGLISDQQFDLGNNPKDNLYQEIFSFNRLPKSLNNGKINLDFKPVFSRLDLAEAA